MKYPTNQVHLISKCGAAHEAFCNSTRTINYVYGSVPGRVFFILELAPSRVLAVFWGNCSRMKEKKRMWKNKGRKREELKGKRGS